MEMQKRGIEDEVYAVYARAAGGHVGVEEQIQTAREAVARRAGANSGAFTTTVHRDDDTTVAG